MQAVASRVAGSSKDSIVNRISLANFQSSTKIEALREELDRMLQRDPSGKAIVFSQFTSMLDLIAFRLQQVAYSLEHGIPHGRLPLLGMELPKCFEAEPNLQLISHHVLPSLLGHLTSP